MDRATDRECRTVKKQSQKVTLAERRHFMRCYCGAKNGSKWANDGSYYRCRNGHLFLIACKVPERKP
jgi:hypothetical protein